tara:strand:+ start:800 stop:1630 length:831 start_codon:yes stop_codon:yes gene_type:complete
MSKTKEEKIVEAWNLTQKYPSQKTAIINHLLNAKTFDVTIEDFNAHDSTMVHHEIIKDDSLTDKFPSVSGFTQSENVSDTEILKIFQAKDEINRKIEDVGTPPIEADWFKAGVEAEGRIEELMPFYQTKMEEEWAGMSEMDASTAIPSIAGQVIKAPFQMLTQATAGWGDFVGKNFKEQIHERGFMSSWNPLTGFGAWDIAEFRTNPLTGKRGFTPELLEMEQELEDLYEDKRVFNKEMNEGGWQEKYELNEELQSLNQIIMENKLLDPRLYGEVE